MGRKPNQEGRKEYLENPRTHFRFSDASDFREVFPNDAVGNETYLKPATGGKRLGKGSFRIVAHLPNKYHDDRENYLNKMKDGSMSRFMPSGSLPANRIRWDGASNAGAHLILHTKDGKRVEFYLVSLGDRNPRGAMVYATAVFPSEKTRKLVQCPVQVGFFGQSKSKPGEYKLTFQKPRIECGKNLAKAGHVPESFLKPDKKGKTVKAAEGGDFFMSEENHTYFHTVTGTQDVQIMNSETQATERAYYNPSDAMVGDETLDRYQITDSSTVDLTSNQPTANYGAEGETATYSPSEEPDMVSSSSFEDPTNAHFSAECSCVPCGTCMAAEAFYAESFSAEECGMCGGKMKSFPNADVGTYCPSCYGEVKNAEGHSLDGYTPIDSLEEGAPIGHGVNQFFGSAEEHKNKWVKGKNGKTYVLRKKTGHMVTHNAESPGGAYPTLEGYSGVDSIAVEAPLGHGVTQWYAENADGPRPVFNEDITGQDGPSASPTNSNFSAQGMRRGRKNKNFNAIVSHRNKRGRFNGNQSVHSNSTGKFLRQGADTAGYLQDGALSLDGYTPLESVDVDRTSYQPTQNYGADQEIDMSFKDSVKVGAGLSVGVAAGSILLGVAGMLSLGLLGSFMGKGD